MTYVPLGQPRFSIVTPPYGDAVLIPPDRKLFFMAFGVILLPAWTFGGVIVFGMLLHTFTVFSVFILFWLCGWGLGWVYVAGTLLWMFLGCERLAVVNGDLQVSRSALWLTRSRVFRGRDISRLTYVQPAFGLANRYNMGFPFTFTGTNGAIRFAYGSRSYDLAAGMDEVEAGLILHWLEQRLPAKGRTP